MKKYKIASLLMFIHGAFMEIGGCLALIPVFVIGSDKFSFKLVDCLEKCLIYGHIRRFAD